MNNLIPCIYKATKEYSNKMLQVIATRLKWMTPQKLVSGTIWETIKSVHDNFPIIKNIDLVYQNTFKTEFSELWKMYQIRNWEKFYNDLVLKVTWDWPLEYLWLTKELFELHSKIGIRSNEYTWFLARVEKDKIWSTAKESSFAITPDSFAWISYNWLDQFVMSGDPLYPIKDYLIWLWEDKYDMFVDAYTKWYNTEAIAWFNDYDDAKALLDLYPDGITEEIAMAGRYWYHKLKDLFWWSPKLKYLTNKTKDKFIEEVEAWITTMQNIYTNFAINLTAVPWTEALARSMETNIADQFSMLLWKISNYKLWIYDKVFLTKEQLEELSNEELLEYQKKEMYKKIMQQSGAMFRWLDQWHSQNALRMFWWSEYPKRVDMFSNTLWAWDRGVLKEVLPHLNWDFKMPVWHSRYWKLFNTKSYVFLWTIYVITGGIQLMMMQGSNMGAFLKTTRLKQSIQDGVSAFREEIWLAIKPWESTKWATWIRWVLKLLWSLTAGDLYRMWEEVAYTWLYNLPEILLKQGIINEALASSLGMTDQKSLDTVRKVFMSLSKEAQEAWIVKVQGDIEEKFNHMSWLDFDHRDSRVLTDNWAVKVFNSMIWVLWGWGRNAFASWVYATRALLWDIVETATWLTMYWPRRTMEVEIEMRWPDDPVEKAKMTSTYYFYDVNYTRYMERIFAGLQYALLNEQSKDDTDIKNIWDFFELFNWQAWALRRWTVFGRAMEGYIRTYASYEEDPEVATLATMRFIEHLFNWVRKNLTPWTLALDMGDEWLDWWWKLDNSFRGAMHEAIYREVGWVFRMQDSRLRLSWWSLIQMPMDNTSIVSMINLFANPVSQERFDYKKNLDNINILNDLANDEFWTKKWDGLKSTFMFWLSSKAPILKNFAAKNFGKSWELADKVFANIDLEKYNSMVMGDSLWWSLWSLESLENAYNIMIESEAWNKTIYNWIRKEIKYNDRYSGEDKFFMNQLLSDLEWWKLLMEDVSNALLPQTKHLTIINAMADSGNPWAWTYILGHLLTKERSDTTEKLYRAATDNKYIEWRYAGYQGQTDFLKKYYPAVYEQALRTTVDKYWKYLKAVNTLKYNQIVWWEILRDTEWWESLFVNDTTQNVIKTPYWEMFQLEMLVRWALASWHTDPAQYASAAAKIHLTNAFNVKDPDKNARFFNYLNASIANQVSIIDEQNIPEESKAAAKVWLILVLAQQWLSKLQDKETLKLVGEENVEAFKTLVYWNFLWLKELESYDSWKDTIPFQKMNSWTNSFSNYDTSKGYYSSKWVKINYKNYQMIRDEFYNFVYKSLPFFYTKAIYPPKNAWREHRMNLWQMTYLKHKYLPAGVNNPISVLVKWPNWYVKTRKWRSFSMRKWSIWITRIPGKPKDFRG